MWNFQSELKRNDHWYVLKHNCMFPNAFFWVQNNFLTAKSVTFPFRIEHKQALACVQFQLNVFKCWISKVIWWLFLPRHYFVCAKRVTFPIKIKHKWAFACANGTMQCFNMEMLKVWLLIFWAKILLFLCWECEFSNQN